MKPFIDERRIQFIQVESECDHWDCQVHEGLPSNKEHLFRELLDENYTLYKTQQGNYNADDPYRWFNRDMHYKLK